MDYKREYVDEYSDTEEDIIRKMSTNLDGSVNVYVDSYVKKMLHSGDSNCVTAISRLDKFDIVGDRLLKLIEIQCDQDLSKVEFFVNAVNYYQMLLEDTVGELLDVVDEPIVENWDQSLIDLSQEQRYQLLEWYDSAAKIKDRIFSLVSKYQK